MDSQGLSSFFDRCYCVSLDREAKWAAFESRIAACQWPFAPIQRFSAIDGQLVKPPPYWRAGAGAWGCFVSHRTLIERSLSDGVRSVLLLEEDAVPCPEFAERVRVFLEAVPNNWGMIYLGGQHLAQRTKPPRRVNDHVLQASNVNRTHAFALSRVGMEAVYSHLMARNWNPRHHIDHRLGAFHEAGIVPVYTPTEWLMGQAEGHSAICGKDLPERFWNGHVGNIDERGTEITVIAVLGPFRSGTSCVAGLLHHLGVSMGDRLRPPGPANPHGFYEAQVLGNICRQLYREPVMTPATTAGIRQLKLAHWLRQRKPGGNILGAKHPSLSMMVPEMAAAWPNCKFVVLDRPAEESVDSLVRAGWKGWTRPVASAAVTTMLAKRDADLASTTVPVLRLAWHDVKANPRSVVDRLVEFCGLAADEATRVRAAATVETT